MTLAAAIGIALCSCNTTVRTQAHPMVPGPAGAISAASLSGDRIAVLAGDDQSKAVYIIDLRAGAVIKSFGVTKEATGMSSEGADGPLLLSVGGRGRGGRPFGAVETWTLVGSKERVVPMPGPALGITRVVDDTAFVMLANRNARSALPLSLPALKVGKPIGLASGAKSLEQCRIGTTGYLVYSVDPRGSVALRSLESGAVVNSAVVADAPTCIADKVFAIQKSFATRSIVVLSLPDMLQATVAPASNAAVELYESPDHHLIALNATSRLSNIETFPDDVFVVKAAPKPPS